jgi:hypothetical protein
MLELALMCPWVFFLFIGALDWGFYSYALISLQSAARSAVLYTRTNPTTAVDAATACDIVRGEMKSLPNVTSLTGCTAMPLTVTASLVAGPDGSNAAQVAVTYRSIAMIPLPGFLQKQFTVTRVVKMRVGSPT